MSILSPVTGLLRSALGVAEHEGTEAVERSPLHATVALEQEFDRLAHALRQAAESADRQAEVLDGVVRSLPTLTEQVTALTAQVTAMNEQAAVINRQLDELVRLLAPLTNAERDVSRVKHLFQRQRHHDEPRAAEDQS